MNDTNPKMTIKAVKAELASYGITFRVSNYGTQEFRIVTKGDGERDAYYTESLQDALETGRSIKKMLDGLGSTHETQLAHQVAATMDANGLLDLIALEQDNLADDGGRNKDIRIAVYREALESRKGGR